MSVHRYCLLGLPKCCSQYILGAINTTFAGNMQNLAEPFSRGHKYNIVQKKQLFICIISIPKVYFIQTFLQRPIIAENRFKKQLPDNPYDIIKEPEQVKDFIKKLIT